MTPNTQITQENVECGACEGVGKIVEAARMHGANQHSACQMDCEDCDGTGRRPALSPPAEGEVRMTDEEWEDRCTCCDNTGITIQTERRCACQPPLAPTPAPVTEKVDWARCQRCGGEIQGWICQDCHQEFEENDAGELVFCPLEAVDWTVVGPKLVEAGYAFIDYELGPYWKSWSDNHVRALMGKSARAEVFIAFRAALTAAQPGAK